MQAFIKSIKTFETTSHNLVLDYEVKYSIYDTVSNITIATPSKLPKEGDILYMENGFMGVISTVSPEYGATTLGCNQIVSLFARNMFYEDTARTYLEDYLADMISENYINCTDSFYAMPYLNVVAETHTASQMGPDLEDNIYSVKSYAAKMRRLYNIFLEWSLTRTSLNLNIARKVKNNINVDFSNPGFKLLSQDFSSSSVSKITSYCEETEEYKVWVLLDDGEIVNSSPSSGRVDGEWMPLRVQKASDVEDAVKDEFMKNEYSHNIEFQAPKSAGFGLYDKLNIKLDNKLFKSYVSGIAEKMGSNIVDIQCGELQMQYPYLELA